MLMLVVPSPVHRYPATVRAKFPLSCDMKHAEVTAAEYEQDPPRETHRRTWAHIDVGRINEKCEIRIPIGTLASAGRYRQIQILEDLQCSNYWETVRKCHAMGSKQNSVNAPHPPRFLIPKNPNGLPVPRAWTQKPIAGLALQL